jgi:signal transduction histidine kinase
MTGRWLVIPAAIAIGLAAETGWPPGVDPRLIVADLAVGWVFIGGGFAVWRSRPANRMGLLLMATGAAWFVATFDPNAAYLYWAPFVHLLVAHPTGRLISARRRAIVAGVYTVAILATVLSIRPLVGADLAVGALIVCIGFVRLVETGRSDQGRWATPLLTVVVGLVLAGVSTGHLIGSSIDDVGLVVYQVALAATVLSIVADIVRPAFSGGTLARVVVDLGGAAEAGTLRERLSAAVGDPSLSLAYSVNGDGHAWVDDTGLKVPRPVPTADRSVTTIVVGGVELGVVSHDPTLVRDDATFRLIAAAAGLAISNSATQAQIRQRVAEVDASRERLVEAADAQGRRIESALENRVDARLTRVGQLLSSVASARPDDQQVRDVIAELAVARARLRDFSRGVYPGMLTSGGLAVAIADLAERSPVPVHIKASRAARYDSAAESTLYFVCAEALANVAKHARARHVTVELTEDFDGPVLRIEDDGVGSPNVAAGSGLRGLVDRVEALGGSLRVEGRPGQGTSVTAALPRTRAGTRMPEAIP